MKASSGRISQYKVLQSTESISKFLVERELFSELTFFDFLERYKSVIIKPVFGTGEISIFEDNNQLTIESMKNMVTSVNKEELYQYLTHNELKQNYYVIQPDYTKETNFFHYLITVHRQTPETEWSIQTITEKIHSVLGGLFYTCFFYRIQTVSILAATKLGETFSNCHTVVLDLTLDLKGNVKIQDSILHFSNSKWDQSVTLIANKNLAGYLPTTDLCTRSTLEEYLNTYQEVILKPCVGKEGKGIIKISAVAPTSYEIQAGKKKLQMSSLDETYQFIKKTYLINNTYLIQEKLPLATVNDCPFDVRVILQKVQSDWCVTAMLCKVAGNGYFITNAAQQLIHLEDAIPLSNGSHLNTQKLEKRIKKVGTLAAQHLEKSNPGINIIGFDIGVSDKGTVWIIEGNYNPNLSMFRILPDQSMYMNILKAKGLRR